NWNPDDLDLAIAGDQDHHIWHQATEVIQNECPFRSEDGADIFSNALQEVKSAEIVLHHLGVTQDEWEERFYGETETVKVGRKYVEISLPFSVWWPRAVAWAQGLELMVKIQAIDSRDIVL
ncbi:hypothetical protein B0H10DRAFT_1781650, partial [Mycena sp. CBHHK59/15]